MSPSSTRFAPFSRRQARAVLAAALALAAWGMAASWYLSTWEFGARQGAYDLEFYRDVVERIHSGKGYYDAVETSFPRFGFTTESMFNWRQPTLATMIGSSPVIDIWHWVLVALAVVSVVCTIQVLLGDCGPVVKLLGTLLLLGGVFSWSLYEFDAFLATEPWCEVLLLLSLCAYARGWWPLGVAATLAALALRELVLPYCVIALVFAAWNKRRIEVLLWFVSLALYVYLMSLHAQEIARRNPGAPSTSVASWLRWPYLSFVLESCVMNVFLRQLPPQFVAIYLPVALIGLAGWRGQIGARLALAAGIYVFSFLFIHAAEYWGYMYSSILVLGALRSPPALRDLWRAAAVFPVHRSSSAALNTGPSTQTRL